MSVTERFIDVCIVIRAAVNEKTAPDRGGAGHKDCRFNVLKTVLIDTDGKHRFFSGWPILFGRVDG